MRYGKRVCLNMIVKNEMANLQRCLGAVADHIDCWVIGDTGSTDGTQDFIRSFFSARNLQGELHEFPFHNFEQARNEALDRAYASPLDFDYLLFDDADMELVVEDKSFREGLTAPGYRLLQRSSVLAYWNTRLVRRDAGARYHGVTHEYLDVPGGVSELAGIWYKDHASGSNRADKFERDARLLLEALEKDPDNHRSWFYLAQSYRDAGRTAEAAVAYAKRAAMGGWDEEAWNARLQQARCLRKLGDEEGFICQALAAFNQRPQRAEPLYDLARYYREKGMNEASILFSELGLSNKRPEQDILFIEDQIYTSGLREEFAIAANYAPDPARKDRGFAACNWLALNRDIGDGPRDLAWSNLFYYVQPAKTMMPSFSARPVEFTAPDGYRPSNPSVARRNDQIILLQRAVNYSLAEDNLQYHTPGEASVHTRNFLLRLDDDLGVQSASEILPPLDLPAPSNDRVLGFEDMRPFVWRDQLWGVSCMRELTPEGWCEQIIARIDEGGPCRLTDWRVLRPTGPRVHEKNWMPLVKPGAATADETLQFVYLCDPTRILDEQAGTLSETTPAIAAQRFRGGSQAIEFADGRLALIHEVQWRAAESRRYYLHRFVWFDEQNSLRKVSRPFFFTKKGVEFAAGLAWHPDERRLLISYSVADCESWLATVDAADVEALLEDVDRLQSGLPEVGTDLRPATAASKVPPGQAGMPNRAGNPAAADKREVPIRQSSGSANGKSTDEIFHEMAPFLRDVSSPRQRRDESREFDARITTLLDTDDATLAQINCFYEVTSEKAEHRTLIAAVTSMRAAGHPVRIWSYAPKKLEFLLQHGIDVRNAEDVMPRPLFERIVAGSEIRYFSDVFRYAVLYEHGGLWMDTDIILLRPFPFRGDHFFNLQWRGSHKGHFICGNVIHAKPYSRHMRALYEMSIERFHAGHGKDFGDVGPKLLSDYIASDAGAELRDQVFSPMFFNAIDWMEIDRFEKPITELADYLNDERAFGVHLWTARNAASPDEKNAPFISQLISPLEGFPALTSLADRFNTDKNRHTGNRHCYARIYDRLLSARRLSMRRLMEIGLCRGLAEGNQAETPSVSLWRSYFPFCQVIGVDLTDFSRLNNDRFKSFVCDQSKVEDLRRVVATIEPGSLDIIIDDGSHASFDEQLTLREFFPLLADGGWYFIEDLDWQPPGEDAAKITLTKTLLRQIKDHGAASSIDPLGVGALAEQFAEILFFDSHYELNRARLLGGLVAIRKRVRSGVSG
ncbi:glycosyltransferase [Mesorhizobium sp. B1-1-8]|uniref:glycosyltransferase n=1 Tax=Mesorhizobium sp. B1-1-8 TaxID=2589976 RepID=UPI001129768E|nr:tetratricopeptide repeat protein [Mesorhizobium sp. B1-1-8]UCI09543.1 tetratricopeptide repeat protein [Mesorhizobium sp. B1-1-8]